MNYFIKRELNEYGPYSLADLQKYVASGNILLTDLCRSEGLTDWVPVSQVIGNIPVPAAAPQPAAGTVYGGGTGAPATRNASRLCCAGSVAISASAIAALGDLGIARRVDLRALRLGYGRSLKPHG